MLAHTFGQNPENIGGRQGIWRFARWGLWLAMVGTWLIQAMASRYKLDADGVSYLDIGTAFWHGNWHAAINGYWSPAYPILIGLWLKIWKPPPYNEITAVRIFGCLMAVLALICLEYLLKVIVLCRKSFPLPDWLVLAPAYALFLWTTTELMPGGLEFPDLLVVAALFLSVAISIQLASGMREWWRFLAFGLVLGMSYLSKAVMFPMAFVFLLTTAVAARGSRVVIRGLLLSLSLFLLVAAPFVISLSQQKGRLTFGDAGALNYARYVDKIDDPIAVNEMPLSARTFKHPARLISETPIAEEFATPLKGTYPLWLDPSYWYEGVRPYFKLRAQLNVIHIALNFYFGIFVVRLGCVLAALISLLLLGRDFLGFARRFASLIAIWGPAAAALAAYSLVHVDERYIGGFVVLLGLSGFAAVNPTIVERSGTCIRCIMLSAVFLLGLQVVNAAGHSASQLLSHQSFAEWEVADALHRSGVPEGSKVSYMGYTLVDHAWARLARVSIVSEIPLNGVSSFWASDNEHKTRVLHLLASTGSVALVTQNIPDNEHSEGWAKVGNTNYYILLLPDQLSFLSNQIEPSYATGLR
jgi:hypothetical protein